MKTRTFDQPQLDNGFLGPAQRLADNIKHVRDDRNKDDDTNQQDDDSLGGEPDILQKNTGNYLCF